MFLRGYFVNTIQQNRRNAILTQIFLERPKITLKIKVIPICIFVHYSKHSSKTNITQNNSHFISVLKSILVFLFSALRIHFAFLLQLVSQESNFRQEILLMKKKVVLCEDTDGGQINGQMTPNSSSTHPRIQLCIPASSLFFSVIMVGQMV